jgi:plasmid stabilization system protein ParE
MKDFCVSDAAAADIKRIVEYTKTHWGSDQGRAVQDRLKETLLMLQAFPGLLSETDKPHHFVKVVSKLPFVIVCKEEKERFTVIQVLHDKQKRSI